MRDTVAPTLRVVRHDERQCSFIAQSSDAVIVKALPVAIMVGLTAAASAAPLQRHTLVLLLLILLLAANLATRLMRVSEETLTVIQGVGIKIGKTNGCGRTHTVCIEKTAIADIFIAEAVRLDRCHFYLGLLMRMECSGEPQIVVPFQHAIPSLAELRVALRGARDQLGLGGNAQSNQAPVGHEFGHSITALQDSSNQFRVVSAQ